MIGDIMLNKDFKNLKNILKYKLFFQVEHNLVLKEGRSVDKNNLLIDISMWMKPCFPCCFLS